MIQKSLYILLCISLMFLLFQSCKKDPDIQLPNTFCVINGDTIHYIPLDSVFIVQTTTSCWGAATCSTSTGKRAIEVREICVNNEYKIYVDAQGAYKGEIPSTRRDSIVAFHLQWGTPGQIINLTFNLNSNIASYNYDNASPGGGTGTWGTFEFR